MSNKAGKAIREEIRSWNLQLRSDKTLEDNNVVNESALKLLRWMGVGGTYLQGRSIFWNLSMKFKTSAPECEMGDIKL